MTTTEKTQPKTPAEHAAEARQAIKVGDEVRVPNHPAYIGRVTEASTFMLGVLFMDGDKANYGRHEVWPESVPFE